MSDIFLTKEEIEHPYANLAVMIEDKRRKAEQMSRTVFHRITASREVLAEKLVYPVSYHWEMEFKYTSNLIPGHKRFETKEEAIAATVARLKEVCDAEKN